MIRALLEVFTHLVAPHALQRVKILLQHFVFYYVLQVNNILLQVILFCHVNTQNIKYRLCLPTWISGVGWTVCSSKSVQGSAAAIIRRVNAKCSSIFSHIYFYHQIKYGIFSLYRLLLYAHQGRSTSLVALHALEHVKIYSQHFAPCNVFQVNFCVEVFTLYNLPFKQVASVELD